MPTYIRVIALPLLAIHILVAGFLLGCRNDDWTHDALGEVASTTTDNKVSGREEPNRAILDSLVGFTIRLVKPLTGATLNVGTTSFTIPPGALPAPAVISYSVVRATPPPGLADMPQRVFRFQPDGLTFLQDCELIVPFDELELGTIDPRSLTCCYYNPYTSSYEPQPTVVDMLGRRFIVRITHFSAYGFGRVQ